MERQAVVAGKAMLATVVRQFAPSRIERQLLAQVFECVVTVRRPEGSGLDELIGDPSFRETLSDADDSAATITTRSAA